MALSMDQTIVSISSQELLGDGSYFSKKSKMAGWLSSYDEPCAFNSTESMTRQPLCTDRSVLTIDEHGSGSCNFNSNMSEGHKYALIQSSSAYAIEERSVLQMSRLKLTR